MKKQNNVDTYIETEQDVRIRHYVDEITDKSDKRMKELIEDSKKHTDIVLEDINVKFELLQEGRRADREATERNFAEMKEEIRVNKRFSDHNFKHVYKEIAGIKKKVGI